MAQGTAGRLYDQFVASMGLEREGLCEALAPLVPSDAEVLYPGCFVHATPSRFFRRVTYVDRNPTAQAFFEDEAGVLRIVNERRRYRGSPAISFIAADYTKPLPLTAGRFDLILSLFAPDTSRSCFPYLRPGGVLVTNNHEGDAVEAAKNPALTWTEVLVERGARFDLVPRDVRHPAPEQALAVRRGTTGRSAAATAIAAWVFRRRAS